MFFPYQTDAPVYHFPYGTIAAIALCTLIFFGLVAMEEETLFALALVHGDGLHPQQWISSNFLHANLPHLAFNMLFLWTFGLIVEGKVGALSFAVLFLGIGISQCAVEQIMMLSSEEIGVSLGASAIVYGLIAIAMVWAPQNEVSIAYVWGYGLFRRVGSFECPVYLLALLYFFGDLAFWFAGGMQMGTEAMHLMGAVIGVVIGAVMVKFELVDCEGWDMFTLMGGHPTPRSKNSHGRRTHRDSPPAAGKEAFAPITPSAEAIRRKLRQLLDQGNVQAAAQLYPKATRGEGLPADLLMALIVAMQQQNMWEDSIPMMVDYLKTDGPKRTPVRLKLAELMVRQFERPQQALAVLAKLDPATLSDKAARTAQQLKSEAEKRVADGSIELQIEDW